MTMPMTPMSNGMFGNGDWGTFLLFALLFGGGNGLLGGRGGAERAITDEFNNNNVISGIRGLERGLSDIGFQNSQNTSSIVSAITQSAFANERGMADLGAKLASCCCDNQLAIANLSHEMSKGFCDVVTAGNLNTRDIIANNTANTQRIVDMMTQNTIQDLRDKNTALTLQVSQSAQTQAIIDALKAK